MLIEYAYGRNYIFSGLESGPELVAKLIEGLSQKEADSRPDPDRFTIREVIAHLADWEPIFLGRMKRICEEDAPVIAGIDEGQLAIDNEYDKTDPTERIGLFRKRRAELIAFLQERKPNEWNRTGNRPEIGIITLEALAVLPIIHDTYHLKQILDIRNSAAK